MIQLVAFLGNYGKKYAGNRHNVAWLFADSLPFADNLSWQKKFQGQYAVRDFFCVPMGTTGAASSAEARKIYFLKPETYMNLSGDSIGQLARFYKIPAESVLVVHDELELPPGTVSLKFGGGLGGHNGLRSTKAVLGTADFWRLRFGIGRPEHKDVAGYVLSDFTADEKIILSQIFPAAGQLLEQIILGDPAKFLPEWNKKKLLP